jgi:hypothetical protein
MILWALLSALVIFQTVRVWRSGAPVVFRTGVLIVASVLVNPHVFVYDAVVLAPALVWLAGWAFGEAHTPRVTRPVFAAGVYGLYLSLLAPTAGFVVIQLSVLVLGGLFTVVSIDLLSSENTRLREPLVATSSAL